MTVTDLPVLSDRGEDQGWKLFSHCFGTNPDVFYPERGQDVRPAKRICAGCPAKAACLAFALRRNERLGIWGGMTERERRRMRRGLPLSVACRFCGREVKAGRLDQVTCNRQACREAQSRWMARQVVGECVQLRMEFDIPTSVVELALAMMDAQEAVAAELVAV